MTGHYDWFVDRLGGDRAELHLVGPGRDVLVGVVRRVGASWEVNEIIDGRASVIAMRPDQQSARKCLVGYLQARGTSQE